MGQVLFPLQEPLASYKERIDGNVINLVNSWNSFASEAERNHALDTMVLQHFGILRK